MDAATFPAMPDLRANFRGPLMLSILLHATLGVAVAAYGLIQGFHGPSWGNNLNSSGAIHVNAVSSLPGIPLPPPVVSTPNTLATHNPGLYFSQPVPKLAPSPDLLKIPKFKEAIRVKKLTGVNKLIQKQKFRPPPNAVPFGEGGPPQMAYTPIINAAGSGGIAFGRGNFGDMFGWYVDAVRSRISNNWLLSTISSDIVSAPRVYVDFDIQRNGTITNVKIAQSSGIPEVDRSALQAVLASNPLAPLPQAYSGNQVHVEFYFDFRRQ
jgi:protein TonB